VRRTEQTPVSELIPVEFYICVCSNMTHNCFCNDGESWEEKETWKGIYDK